MSSARVNMLRRATLALPVALASSFSQALAQGCPLCRETAAQAPGAIAINYGILILLVPTIGIFLGIVYRLRRGR